MSKPKTRRRLVRITMLTGVLFGVPAIAVACSLVSAPRVYDGLLGVSFESAPAEDGMVIPRNFAFINESTRPTLEGGARVEFEPAEMPGLLRVQSPVAAGATVFLNAGVVARVGDAVDTEPPGQATVVGGAFDVEDHSVTCGTSSCGDSISRLLVDVAAPVDDNTPEDRLTYALYSGRTAEVVATAAMPDGYFVRDEGTVWRYGASAEEEDDIWVSVAAIDQAGNAGPRSEPVQVHAATGGCAVSRRFAGATWFPLLLTALWLRRRSRR